MIEHLFLVASILLIAASAYRRFKYDLLSPTVISCVVFTFSVLLSCIGLTSWNHHEHLNGMLIAIFLTGLFCFYLGEILARKLFFKNHKIPNNRKPKPLQPLKIKKWLLVVTIIFVVSTIIVLIFEIKRVCAAYGFESNSIPKLLAFYRSKTALFSSEILEGGADIGFLAKQMKKVVDAICLIFTYVVVRNVIARQKKTKIILPAVILLLCYLSSFLSSGRSLLMHFLVALVIIALLLFYKTQKPAEIRQNNRRLIPILCATCIIVLAIFYAVLPLTGRSTQGESATEYISFYLGTSVPSFNSKVHHVESKSDDYLIGEKTFDGLYQTFNRYGIIDYTKPTSNEWVWFKNFKSNVYTSFFSYYYDFGFLGVIVLQFIFGLVISYLYLYARYAKNTFLLLIYANYTYILIDQIRDDHFYGLISSSTIVYLMIIYCLYYIYIQGFSYQKFITKYHDLKNTKSSKINKKK